MFEHLAIAPQNNEVFLDMGCGMGRPLVVASQYPFRRIIGVEISPELTAAARRNVEQAKVRCPHIELVNTDASCYEIPDDVSVIYFANPFRGETLDKTVGNIYASLLRRPRIIRIIYYNRLFFDDVTANKPWIRKVFHTPCFPRASWALYEAALPAGIERRQKCLQT
jgi:SAM-dependent methyltransferase